MIEAGLITSERRHNLRSALALRPLFWLLAILAICGTPLGAGNGWASATDLARTVGVSARDAIAKVECDKSYVEDAKLLSFAAANETADDAVVAPPQVLPRAGDDGCRGHVLAPREVLQPRTRSFDSQAPPVPFSFV